MPNAALDGFPAGRRPPTSRAAGCCSSASPGRVGVRAEGARLGGGLGVGRRGGGRLDQNCLVLLYLAGGNDGLNTLVPNGAADYASYVGRAAGDPPAPGRRPRAGASGRRRWPATAAQQLAFANVDVSRGGGDNGDATCGFDTLYGDGTAAGLGSVHARGRLAAAPTSATSTTSDIWFKASYDLNVKTGWLGPLDRPQRLGDQPAAGDLDRHRALEVDPHRGQPGVRDPVARRRWGSHEPAGRLRHALARQRRRCEALRRRSRPAAANAYLARTRGTYGVAVETHQRRPARPAYDAGRRLPATPARCRPAAARRAPAVGANLGTRIITIHWGGFDTHSDQLAGQDAQLTRAVARARARSGPTCARAASRTASRRSCSPSSAGAWPRTARRAPTTAPAA